MKKFTKSEKLFKKAIKLIPLASQTFSKSYLQYVRGASPLFASRAKGAYIWDVDGNKYVDMINGLLPVILGYQCKAVDNAIKNQLKKGIIFSLPSPLEFELAELLKKHIPCAEMARFGKNGSDATTGAVRLARAVTGRDMVATCYDEETEVLTKEGFKRFSELKDNEVVATLNPDTKELEYHRILNSVKYRFKEKMIHFKGQRLDLLVTPDHRVYRRFQQREGDEFKLDVAANLLGRRNMVQMTSACEWRGQGHGEVKVRIPLLNQNRPTKGLTAFPSKDFVRFLGWYLSEGCCVVQKRGRYEVSISQDEKNKNKSEEIFEVIRRLGFRAYRNGHHICFNSKELVKFLLPFGKTKEKYIPDWIKDLSREYLEVFVDAMVKGDGTFEDGRMRKFYSTSKKLIDGMQEILLKLGYSSTIFKIKENGFSKGEIYHLNISKEVLFGGTAREVDYDGFVYCVTVPNHIILVRRNGKIVWSGNCGFHGWHDWYIGSTAKNLGVPESTRTMTRKFVYNDIVSLEKLFKKYPKKFAAVIMEPMNYEEPKDGFLKKVEKLAHKYGALLIFDEVITGFRFGLGGAQKYFGVIPDLACFGKSMANGMPISALVGKKKYMKRVKDIFYSFTQGGETLSIAAAIATIKEIENKKVIPYIWKLGKKLQDGGNELIKKHKLDEIMEIKGRPCWQIFSIKPFDGYSDLEIKSYMQQELIQVGFLWFGSHNMSFSHTEEDIKSLLAAYDKIFSKLKILLETKKLKENLKGEPITNIFKVR